MADISGRKDVKDAVVICRFKPFDFRVVTKKSKMRFRLGKRKYSPKTAIQGKSPAGGRCGEQI